MLPRLCHFVEDALVNRRKAILAFTFLILIAGPIDSFTVSVSKGYIKDTALWAAENLPKDSKVITFDTITDYYLRENNFTLVTNLEVGGDPLEAVDYEYLVIVIKLKNMDLYDQLNMQGHKIIYSSSNNRGDIAIVVKVNHS